MSSSECRTGDRAGGCARSRGAASVDDPRCSHQGLFLPSKLKVYGATCSYGYGSKLMVPFWGRCTTHFKTYFSGDWDVHWGYGLLTHQSFLMETKGVLQKQLPLQMDLTFCVSFC